MCICVWLCHVAVHQSHIIFPSALLELTHWGDVPEHSVKWTQVLSLTFTGPYHDEDTSILGAFFPTRSLWRLCKFICENAPYKPQRIEWIQFKIIITNTLCIHTILWKHYFGYRKHKQLECAVTPSNEEDNLILQKPWFFYGWSSHAELIAASWYYWVPNNTTQRRMQADENKGSLNLSIQLVGFLSPHQLGTWPLYYGIIPNLL